MTRDRWTRLQAIFEEVIELPRGEREAALARLCPDDPDLRAEAEAMLAADDDDPDFLETPAAPLAADPTVSEMRDDPVLHEGDAVGPYRIVRLLGEGGMGVVYLAERDDDQFHRQVALKIVKRGMDTGRVLRRFRDERQILASLTHPNVGHLYDGGMTDDGLPYFAMEYVDGAPIDDHCRENDLPLARRLDLMQDVCAAVHHAHQNLIVHRDLKPSNVMVNAEGAVKLLDFGIAKLLDDHDLSEVAPTLDGPRPLTPDFASPEQIRGEPLTTAADVYSLGVLLHVLLTGERPHRLTGTPAHELAAAVDALPPPRPSEADVPWAASLRGDLDTIVRTAMHPDPARRYRSAQALADDLRRHLRGHPIEARSDSVAYRTGKFVRRNRVGVSLAVGVFALTLGFALVALRQAGEIGRQAEAVAHERDRAEDVTSVLIDMFDVSDPLHGSVTRGDTLRVSEFLRLNEERLLTRLADQPELKATVSHLMGRLYANLGLYEEALPLIQGGLDLRRQLHGDEPDEDTARSLDFLGTVIHNLGRFDEAEPYIREALAMRRELYDPPNLELAESLNNLAWNLSDQDRDEEGIVYDREALAMRRALLGDRHPDVAQSLNNLGSTLYYLGRADEAEPLWREALDIRRETLGEDHPYTANTLNNLARLLRDRGEYEESVSMSRRAIAIWSGVFGPDHPRLAAGYYNLALASEDLGDLDEAIAAMGRAYEIDTAALPADHPFLASDALELGRLQLAAGHDDRAEDLLRQCLSIHAAQANADPEERARAETLLAKAEGRTEGGTP